MLFEYVIEIKQAIRMKFDLVYIDPPWFYTSFSTASASQHYNLMTQEDICKLKIKDLCKKNAAVLVWATGPKLNDAIEAIERWGLHYRGVAFVWVKTRKTDNAIISGQGVPPTFTKPTTEFLLLATTSKTGRPLKLQSSKEPQVILAPREGHSVKPATFRRHIASVLKDYASLDKIEIFARQQVVGWTTIGNGITPNKDIRDSIQELLDK